jgi:NAD(P)-dependent dehydrogenase (short-subunit alcohol dehydrogenase family)
MLLANKNAVVYGGEGEIGGTGGRAFAREGARVFPAGRTISKVEAVAEEIRSTGGAPETPPRSFGRSIRLTSCVSELFSYAGNGRLQPDGRGRKEEPCTR